MVRIQPKTNIGAKEDENVDRGNWSRQLDFILSCLGYAVGLGNIWRFPHLSYTNGGESGYEITGAFFIPYLLMSVFIGMPMFFMEVSIGQFSSSGPVTAFRFCPLLAGVGIGMVTVSVLIGTYYNVIIAWAIYYLVASFQRNLPWSGCSHEWNTWMCSEFWPQTACNGTQYIRYNNGTCYKILYEDQNESEVFEGLWDIKRAANYSIKPILPSEEYLFNEVLKQSEGIHVLGEMNWMLLLCLITAWAIVYVSLIKGVKSSGKVVYFTAIFPYVILILLLINGLMLEGAGNGISFYLKPVWSRLGESKVWSNAASQVFYSLSICCGGLMTLASYNKFQNNILKDTLIITTSNSLTSLFAGFVIYCYIGHLAHMLGVEVSQVSDGGIGLAFIIFPAAFLTLPVPPIWSALFFFNVIILGLDTQFGTFETVTTMLFDIRPLWRSRKPVIMIFCVILFIIPGSLMCTQGGVYILALIDDCSAGYNIIILCLLEIFSVTVLYGYKRFSNDIKLMIGSNPSLWWKFCWRAAGPVILLFVLVMATVNPDKSDKPVWVTIIGWMISSSVLVWIPSVAIYHLIHTSSVGKTFKQLLQLSIKPHPSYGPALPKYRELVNYVPGFIKHPSTEQLTKRVKLAAAEMLVYKTVKDENEMNYNDKLLTTDQKKSTLSNVSKETHLVIKSLTTDVL